MGGSGGSSKKGAVITQSSAAMMLAVLMRSIKRRSMIIIPTSSRFVCGRNLETLGQSSRRGQSAVVYADPLREGLDKRTPNHRDLFLNGMDQDFVASMQ